MANSKNISIITAGAIVLTLLRCTPALAYNDPYEAGQESADAQALGDSVAQSANYQQQQQISAMQQQQYQMQQQLASPPPDNGQPRIVDSMYGSYYSGR